ncbi:MAG: MazG nucleotide pyrophosphohydrolase [Gemmatimonadetes bacterium]|nr:MazG nucleotide pyrophosphohydrolase [Gemmatimonadota bacterium]
MVSLSELTRRLRSFTEERGWQQFHDPKNLTMLLASEAGELLAEFRWVQSTESDEHATKVGNRQRIEREIGDVGIALLLLCSRMDVSLEDLIDKKIAENAINYPIDESKGRADRPVA